MIVGVLREIKDNENRVALTPKGARALREAGHTVLIEKSAGLGSGFPDKEYETAGAKIISSPKEICTQADMIMKIKEPLPSEYSYFKHGQIIFTYFHFASNKELCEGMLESKAACVAYETVKTADGKTPLLSPMSKVAGRMAPLMGAYYLAKFNNGRGVLPCPVNNADVANFVVIGGGIVGTAASEVAAGIGSNLTILELNDSRIEQLKNELPKAKILKSTPENIEASVKTADVLIGSVYCVGAKCPHLVSESLVKQMRKGAVIVDVAIDQGGCIETSHPTSHSDPVFEKHGVIHYCVANMPGAYPRTSTMALTNETLPYALKIANKGLKTAMLSDPVLMNGLEVFNGKMTNKDVADLFKLPYQDKKEALG